MKSVWVIEQGSYSDYRVVGVYSSKKNAQLGGTSFSAQNAAKTHCAKGHEFKWYKVKRNGTQRRQCQTCRNEQNKLRKRAAKQRLLDRLASEGG